MTLDEEIGVALGEMGMSYESYLSLTPSQFQGAYNRFLKKTTSDREHAENVAWQVARWQVWRTLCPPEQKKISVFDLIELSGDAQLIAKQKNQEIQEKDEKRFKALAEKWK